MNQMRIPPNAPTASSAFNLHPFHPLPPSQSFSHPSNSPRKLTSVQPDSLSLTTAFTPSHMRLTCGAQPRLMPSRPSSFPTSYPLIAPPHNLPLRYMLTPLSTVGQ